MSKILVSVEDLEKWKGKMQRLYEIPCPFDTCRTERGNNPVDVSVLCQNHRPVAELMADISLLLGFAKKENHHARSHRIKEKYSTKDRLEDIKTSLGQKASYICRLEAFVGKEVIPDWLDRPNKAFDGRTPMDVLTDDDPKEFERMISFFESGVSS